MKQKFKVLFITFSLLFLLQRSTSLASSAESVELLSGEKYFEKVQLLLNSATKSILVAIYSFEYYDDYPNSHSNILAQDLIKAKERGIDVTVLLDVSDWNEENTKENRKTGKILSKNGIKIYYDSVETLTHAKTIVIDSRYTIIGSHNWTYLGLSKNNEISVLINSKELANQTEKYIMDIIKGK